MPTVGVMTLLEGEARNEALRLWRLFETEFGSVGVRTFAHPNLTFGAARCDDPRSLSMRLEALAQRLETFPVRISGVGFFDQPQNAAFLGVEKTPALEQVHRAVDEVLQRRCMEVLSVYRPASWVPHVTIGMGDLSREALERARTYFASYDRSFVYTARRITLVQSANAGPGFQVTGHWQLGG